MHYWSMSLSLEQKRTLMQKAENNCIDALLNMKAAETAYFSALHDYIYTALRKKGVRCWDKVSISFSDGDEVCRFEGLDGTRLKYRSYTKTGKLYKNVNSTVWDMWEHMERIGQ